MLSESEITKVHNSFDSSDEYMEIPQASEIPKGYITFDMEVGDKIAIGITNKEEGKKMSECECIDCKKEATLQRKKDTPRYNDFSYKQKLCSGCALRVSNINSVDKEFEPIRVQEEEPSKKIVEFTDIHIYEKEGAWWVEKDGYTLCAKTTGISSNPLPGVPEKWLRGYDVLIKYPDGKYYPAFEVLSKLKSLGLPAMDSGSGNYWVELQDFKANQMVDGDMESEGASEWTPVSVKIDSSIEGVILTLEHPLPHRNSGDQFIVVKLCNISRNVTGYWMGYPRVKANEYTYPLSYFCVPAGVNIIIEESEVATMPTVTTSVEDLVPLKEWSDDLIGKEFVVIVGVDVSYVQKGEGGIIIKKYDRDRSAAIVKWDKPRVSNDRSVFLRHIALAPGEVISEGICGYPACDNVATRQRRTDDLHHGDMIYIQKCCDACLHTHEPNWSEPIKSTLAPNHHDLDGCGDYVDMGKAAALAKDNSYNTVVIAGKAGKTTTYLNGKKVSPDTKFDLANLYEDEEFRKLCGQVAHAFDRTVDEVISACWNLMSSVGDVITGFIRFAETAAKHFKEDIETTYSARLQFPDAQGKFGEIIEIPPPEGEWYSFDIPVSKEGRWLERVRIDRYKKNGITKLIPYQSTRMKGKKFDVIHENGLIMANEYMTRTMDEEPFLLSLTQHIRKRVLDEVVPVETYSNILPDLLPNELLPKPRSQYWVENHELVWEKEDISFAYPRTEKCVSQRPRHDVWPIRHAPMFIKVDT